MRELVNYLDGVYIAIWAYNIHIYLATIYFISMNQFYSKSCSKRKKMAYIQNNLTEIFIFKIQFFNMLRGC